MKGLANSVNLSVLCGGSFGGIIHHRDTEHTKDAQRRELGNEHFAQNNFVIAEREEK
jgi:hypothetical protein